MTAHGSQTTATRPHRRFALLRRDDGQAALEWALTIPLFLMFGLLLIDLGIGMYQYVSVSNAVREGARFGSVNCGDALTGCTENDIVTRTLDRSGGILSDPTEVDIAWIDNNGGTNRNKGDSVVVRVEHPYSFLFVPFVTLPVISCADMRLEQQDGDGSAVLPDISPC